ncbi:MAG TPA: hypothetical protein VHD14_02455 [Pseudolabrys sp.]|jgi:hypothetical protein|nr:hypothetical protein [Pseudolabrys sp.]
MKTQLKTLSYAVLVAAVAGAFMLGSAGTSEAAKKKAAAKPAPAQQTEVMCLGAQKPVCGTKGGMKFTYANSCFAAKDGAKVSSNKACAGAKGGKAKMAKASKPAKKSSKKKM